MYVHVCTVFENERVAICLSKPACRPLRMHPPPQRPLNRFETQLSSVTPPSIALFSLAVTARRDKKWHFIFTVLSTWHFFLLAFGAFAAHRQSGEDGGEGTGDGGLESDWQEASRLFMLGAHALRPIMLISNLQTTRRVFTNVLRRVC